jgi:hypothetical protein
VDLFKKQSGGYHTSFGSFAPHSGISMGCLISSSFGLRLVTFGNASFVAPLSYRVLKYTIIMFKPMEKTKRNKKGRAKNLFKLIV